MQGKRIQNMYKEMKMKDLMEQNMDSNHQDGNYFVKLSFERTVAA